MTFEEGGAVRSPGLLLILVACLVGWTTQGLMRARATHADVRRDDDVMTSSAAVPAVHPLLPASLAGLEDELLASALLHDPEFRAEVERWVGLWETNYSEWMPSYLDRMTAFEDMVDETLAEHDLPWSLRYLPVIESGYSPSAVSSASAVGMWQFMAATARDFGIEVGPLVDDRRDPFVSTAAAADYLVQLRAEFGSWFLALAAYNAGPDRIHGIVDRYLPEAEPSDAVYWALRDVLPKETADFVPNLIGAIIVASEPEAHGYVAPTAEPFDFDGVPVLGAISFETVARAVGTSRDEIARLNPEYVSGVTPRDRQVELRLPPGSGVKFRDYFTRAQDTSPGGRP